MMRIKIETMWKMINDGWIECMTDVKIGVVDIRWTRTNKFETVWVVEN